jgi:uncharacterized protein involved in type VI secretion and phage assembly
MGNQALIQVSSQSPGLTAPGNLSASSLSSVMNISNYGLQTPATWEQSSMQAWANALMVRSTLCRNIGSVRFQGNATVLPGTMLTLAGLGQRFNGNVYITSVKHEIAEGNWITTADYGISAETYAEQHPDITGPETSGLVPGVRGLQYGVVKQIQSDTDGQYRVLVNMPMVASDGTGVWARLATFYATKNAGNYFYPEVNDEVILGFLNDDPAYPVILGSLYSSNHTPPYTPDEKNSTKAIVTNAQLKIIFDDENKVTTIITPSNNQIILSDKDSKITIQDQNSNSIVLSSSGIALTSASAISIKAQTTVTIEGQSGITASSSAGDVKLSGLNVNAEGQMALTAKGGMTAEFSASGQTTLKGAIVMIN